MAIEWDERLATGVTIIDNQHKELFRRLGNLFDAIQQRKGKNEALKMLDFLGDYVVSHFGTEEEYMRKFNFPDSPQHRKEHDDFKMKFLELKREFEAEGETIVTTLRLNRAIVDWLNKHIRVNDKALANFLKSHSIT